MIKLQHFVPLDLNYEKQKHSVLDPFLNGSQLNQNIFELPLYNLRQLFLPYANQTISIGKLKNLFNFIK